jgi:predicted GNAT family acetyltransferase
MAELPPIVMNETTHRFEVTLERETAFAEYKLEPGVIVLPHTVVPEALGGRGIASALIRAGLGYAREHGLKVKPICPFVAGYIEKHPEVQDLVHPDFREKLGLAG